MSLLQKIDRIWQSQDPAHEAKECCEVLSLEEKEVLTALASHLDSYISSRALVDRAQGSSGGWTEGQTSSEDLADLLLLLMLAMHHSDSLVLLSPELRQGRLNSWAQWTNQSPDRVKAACMLGPANLRSFVEAK